MSNDGTDAAQASSAGQSVSGDGGPGRADPPRSASLAAQKSGAAPRVAGDGTIRSGRLAGMSMRRAMWVLSWPILVQSLLQTVVGLVDTVLAAGVSEAATDAIGGASYIFWFMGLVMLAIGVGSTALISRSIGGGRLAVANAAVGQSMLLAAVSGVFVGLIIAAATGWVARILSMSPEAAEAFRVYMLINAAAVPIMGLLFVGNECLRAAGDSLRPLVAMVVVNIVNIVVSWSLAGVDYTSARVVDGEVVTRTLLHNPFGFNLGITGIALGTVIAHAVGAAMICTMLARGRSGIVLRPARLKPHATTMWRLLRVGIPNFLETFGMWIGNFAVLLMVGWLTLPMNAGAGGANQGLLGAHIVAIRLEAFSYLPGFAMGAAAATLVGQYLGAGSPRFAKRAVLWCTGVAAAFMTVAGFVFIFAPERITGLLTGQPSHLQVVPTVMFITGLIQFPFAVGIVLRSALRGAGDVKWVMALTWITTYGVRLPLAYGFSGVDIPVPAAFGGGVLDNPFWSTGEGFGLVGIWIGLSIEVVFRATMFSARFFRGRWAEARV